MKHGPKRVRLVVDFLRRLGEDAGRNNKVGESELIGTASVVAAEREDQQQRDALE